MQMTFIFIFNPDSTYFAKKWLLGFFASTLIQIIDTKSRRSTGRRTKISAEPHCLCTRAVLTNNAPNGIISAIHIYHTFIRSKNSSICLHCSLKKLIDMFIYNE